MKRKNLVFIMTDQQRADTLGMTACGTEVTPALNALAQESCVFERAYNACPLCVPARTALATGLSPLTTGMRLNDLAGVYASRQQTIHEMLAKEGYEAAHIGVAHIVTKPPLQDTVTFAAWECDETYERAMQQRGVCTARDARSSIQIEELGGQGYRLHTYSNARVSVWPYAVEDFKDVWFTDRALEYLRRPHEQPFALFLYLWAPHPPLVVPKAYLDKFPYGKIVLPLNTDVPAQGEPESYRTGAAARMAEHPPEKGWQQAWSAHLALSHLADEQIGRVVDCLQQQKLWDHTVLVFTSDHGEQLGQHGMYQKMEMYEPSVRVPALMRVPGAPACRWQTPISHLDFVPTLAQLMGLPAPLHTDGVSLAETVMKAVQPPVHDVVSVYCGNHEPGDLRRMLVRGSWKYVFDGIHEELYDVSEDPLEMRNLAYEPALQGKKRELALALRAYCFARGEQLPPVLE